MNMLMSCDFVQIKIGSRRRILLRNGRWIYAIRNVCATCFAFKISLSSSTLKRKPKFLLIGFMGEYIICRFICKNFRYIVPHGAIKLKCAACSYYTLTT